MRIATSLILLLATVTTSAAQQAPTGGAHRPASFAGRWVLDTSQSRDLPFFYAAIREHTLAIAQSDSTLTVDVTMVDTAGVAQEMQFAYDLRRPVRTTTQVRTPRGPRDIPTTLTAVARSDGGIDITIAREVAAAGSVGRPGDRETWHLSADGQQLRIHREAEMPGPDGMRTIRAHYVFARS